MITIKIYLRKHVKDATSGIIWISFYVNREKVNFSTKVCVEEKNWSEKKQRVTNNDKLADDKNLIIDNILARVNNVFVKYRLKDKRLTRDSFFRAYNRPDDYDTFFDYIKAKFKNLRMELGTYCSHQSAINKLMLYSPALHFDDIDVRFLDLYFSYLKKECENNDNTAYKNMAILKKYIRLAYKDGYLEENPFDEWKIRKVKSNCVYLVEDELNLLIDLYKSGELEYPLHRTLEFFLFLCFSSLHIGDAKKLKLEQFNQTTFTYYRIKLRNSKPEPIVVPISQPLQMLMTNIVGHRKKGPIFEKLLPDQTMNRYLKEIAAIAGIGKAITHKVGRHTFATLYLRKTKDIAALKEILGHSDISETLVYAHVLEESKLEGIKCFDGFSL
jgi:site-specific recombinase XerD